MRFLNCVFIVIFIVILTLPLIFIDLSKNRISVQENRMLAEFPNLNIFKKHPVKFIRSFDDWFKDSTGFRKQLLTIYNDMGVNTWMNKVMYKKGKDIYLIGENGHHFFAEENGFLIRRFQGEQILSDGQLANLANKLEEVKIFLKGKGIPFVFMICPFKELIYPEYYPKSIKRGPEPTQFDIITKYLQERTSIDVFNIKQALLTEKDNYLLYPVSSGDLYHYTEIGAFFAYRELMKHINVYFHDIIPFDLNDIDISFDKTYNNILEPDVSLKKEQSYKKLDISFFDDVELNRPFYWENTAYENKNPNLPVILVFRDSYSGYSEPNYEKKYLTQFLASHFGKAIFIHWLNIKRFEEYVAKYKPDIVVFETAGLIDRFAKSVGEIPELVTAYGDSNEAQ